MSLFSTTDKPIYNHLKVFENMWETLAAEVPPWDGDSEMIKRRYVSLEEEGADPATGAEFIAALKANSNWIAGWEEKNIWYNFPLVINDSIVGKAAELCPQTVAALLKVGKINLAGFSLLLPNSSLPVHTDSCGPTTNSIAFNLKLNGGVSELHVQQPNGKFAVHRHKAGRAVLFNSELNHFATNAGGTLRTILYINKGL